MLYPSNESLLRCIAKETSAQYLHEAEIDHLLSEVKPRQSSRFLYLVRRVLNSLGRLLVALGRRLDRLGTRPA